jgi:L-aspartate oxidase
MTGVHGANRLASNSLLEGLVFSDSASAEAIDFLKQTSFALPDIPDWDDSGTLNTDEWVLISHNRHEIRELMWDYVGIVRSTLRLERAERRIDLIRREVDEFYRRTRVSEGLLELRNLCVVAHLIIRSALMRKESRGLHYMTDFPTRDDKHWLGDSMMVKTGEQELAYVEPVKQ